MNSPAHGATSPAAASPAGRSPWVWIPSLYFGQAIPYVVVMTLSVVLYKRMGVSNTDIALYTSWLYLPWVIKPLWSPLVDLFGRKGGWVVWLQLGVGVALASVALVLPVPGFFQMTLAVFWLMAFASATHDIAADGFYMLALKTGQQAAFVGVRSTFYRLAMIAGQGGLVYLAGQLEEQLGSVVRAWQIVFVALGVGFAVLALWHRLVLPRPAVDGPVRGRMTGQVDDQVGAVTAAGRSPVAQHLREFVTVFVAFFRRPDIGLVLAVLLLFRLGEAQLLKLAAPFMLDAAAQGGLGLSTSQVGIVYGMVGVGALTLGGLLGGWVISRIGLKRALLPLMVAVHLPNLLYVGLAMALPQDLWVAAAAVAVEQFGYGFGFTAYLMFMIWVARGPAADADQANPHQTAHYAICTGFMALGMMLPGMWSGWLQDWLGYTTFFVWVTVATVPSLVVATMLKLPADFGRAEDAR
ncbi:MAG: MFS transporter [Rubrivivax sp.]